MPPRSFLALWLFTLLVVAATVPFAAPIAAQPAETTLLPLELGDLRAFRPTGENWRIAGGVRADRSRERDMSAVEGTGVLVNLPDDDRSDHLFTTWEHGDLEMELEVMMPRGSNSGIYLQGRYEVQLFDSWGVERPRYSDVGGIYQRWDDRRPAGREGFEGIAPRLNAARAPGLWQHLAIRFEAPRFDAAGRKVSDARFVRVVLNGVVVQENVAVTGPTREAAFTDEQAAGPLMIQGDHGPVAFRNIRYKRLGGEPVQLAGVRYRYFPGAFEAFPDLSRLQPAQEGGLEGFRHDVASGDTFAVAFDGALHAPTAGIYRFVLDLGWFSDDPHFSQEVLGGSELRVGDRVVLDHEQAARAEGTVVLEAGTHPFSLVYYKHWGYRTNFARLTVEGPDTPPVVLNVAGTLPERTPPARIAVDVDDEPYVLRSMIRHRGERRTHAVSVGSPNGMHYAMDLDLGALLYVWKGPFVDATPMWHSRGTDQVAVPLGSVVSFGGATPLARLSGNGTAWVEEGSYRFDGYELDAAGRPTFRYRVGELAVADRLVPDGEGLVRTLRVQGAAGAGQYWVRLAEGRHIERLADGAYSIDDRSYYLDVHGAATDPEIRTIGGRQELLLPLRFSDDVAQVRYALVW